MGLEAQEVERLRRHPLVLELPLADETGRCRLLTEDSLCTLHRDEGWHSKPRACRQFPFFLVETPDGVQVGLSFRCTAVQQNIGPDWSEHLPALTELASEGIPRLGFEPVRLGSKTLEWSTYRRWEGEWRAAAALTPAVERSLAEILPLVSGTLPRLTPILAASAIAFLESQTADQAAEVAAAVRGGMDYFSQRRGQTVAARPDPFSQPADGPARDYLDHVLERKSPWLGSDFLGRLLMVLAAELMLNYYSPTLGFWGAVDRVEGEWLAHRRELDVLESQFAATLLQLC